jgi:beta-phosphoglucomutase
MKPEAIFFDLDGVLVDACDWHYLALNKALKGIVGKQISRTDHVNTYNGLPTRVKLDMLGLTPEQKEEVWWLKQEVTKETILTEARIMTDKIKLHKYLQEEGIKICCVTNSIKETAELMLKVTGQLPFMDEVITNEDVKHNKPYPDCYNLAVSKIGANPKECIIVEDSPKGMDSARKSVVPDCNIWNVKNASDVVLDKYRSFINENFNTNGRRRVKIR